MARRSTPVDGPQTLFGAGSSPPPAAGLARDALPGPARTTITRAKVVAAAQRRAKIAFRTFAIWIVLTFAILIKEQRPQGGGGGVAWLIMTVVVFSVGGYLSWENWKPIREATAIEGGTGG